ncbi:phage tail protein [Zhihengliuella halotolerans]|uniref:phage tail protein n=1 Tax=Zhihengliuella halotolerans TaxID=370736 RepID=UPI000C7FDEEC|nr:tape measure protein [Zhihengliuella halotolerans]
MAGEVANAWVSITPTFDGGIKKIQKELGGVGDPAGKKAGKGFASGIGGAAVKAGKVAAGAVAVVGGALGAIALKGGISRALQIEDAQAKLTGLGHDTKNVDKIMDNALASVKGTALGLGDAATVAASSVAAGVKPGKDLERTLSLVGDAATIAGTDMGSMGAIFNKVAASNKVQMDTINQLHDAGVPALQLLADELGVTAEEASKMASAGKIDFATFQKAMEEGMGGAALKSGQTFRGAMANTYAALGRIGETVAQPFLDIIKIGFNTAIPILDGFNAALKPIMKTFGEWMSANVPGFISEISGGFTAMKAAFEDGEDQITSSGLAGFLEGIGVVARNVSDAVGPLFSTMLSAVGPLIPQVLEFASAFSPLSLIFQIIQPLLPQITGMFGQMAGMVSQLVAAVLPLATQLVSTVVPVLLDLAAAVFPMVISVVETIVGLLPQLVPMFTMLAGSVLSVVSAVLPLVAQLATMLLPIITQLVTAVLPLVVSAFAAIVPAVMMVVDILVATLVPIIQALLPVIQTVFSAVATIITAVMQIISGVIQVVTGVISGNWSAVWNGIKTIFAGVWNAIKGILKAAWAVIKAIFMTVVGVISGLWAGLWTGVKTFFSNTWNSIVGFLAGFIAKILANVTRFRAMVTGIWSALWSRISGFLLNMLSTMIAKVAGFIARFVGFFRELPGKITGFLSSMPGKLLQIGKDMIQGLINGIGNMAGAVTDKIGGVVSGAIDGAKRLLGINSPSRVFMEIGEYTGEGMSIGLERQSKAVQKAAEAMAPSLNPDGYMPARAFGAEPRAGTVNNFYTYNPVAESVSKTKEKKSSELALSGGV